MTFAWLFRRRRRYFRFTRHVAGAIRRRLVRGAVLLALLFAAHAGAMMAAEGLDLPDALWLTITTATTVGYGDLSAKTPAGRLATLLCLYSLGIFLLAQIAADVFDYRALKRERRRRGEFKWKHMKDHLLIVNVPADDTETYLSRLVSQIRRTPSLGGLPVQLLTPRYPDGLPAGLVEAGVTHYHAVAESSESLEAVNAGSARCIIVIADDAHAARSDALTFDVLSRIRQMERKRKQAGVVVAEVVEDANRRRILEAGATTVVRPVRAYPELVVRALVAPGVEQVLENLFTHDAARLARFDVAFDGLRWGDVVVSFVNGGAGVPMGYVDERGVHTNPPAGGVCAGSAVITLVADALEVTRPLVESCLQAARNVGAR